MSNGADDKPSRDTPQADAQTEWRPRANPWLIALAVMLATFMEVLDTTIINVALPHIAGSLAASNSEATWVLTSYLVSNAIILPASAWLASIFGRKRFLILCIIVFTISSFLCGAATSLGMLIVMRIFQGAGGGALQPFSQAILLESFPPQQRGMAMAIFGMGIVVAPVIGPTLGGWITDNYEWRWVFYINIPVGILATFLLQRFIEDPPYIRQARAGRIDAIGFGLLVIWIATLQIILDKGQEDDWFSAVWIRWFALVSAVGFIAFIVRELRTGQPLVNLRVFANRNFAVGTSIMFLVGLALYASIVMVPLFLQTLMGYTAFDSGLTQSPRGLGALVMMPIVGMLIGRFDSRWLIAIGFVLFGAVNWILSGLTLGIAQGFLVLPSLLMGISFALIFVPLTTVSLGTLDNAQIGNATGIYNLMRNLGGSVGISLVTTLVERGSQAHQALMVSHLTPNSPTYQAYLHALTERLGSERRAMGVIYGELQSQAGLWAYINNFRLLILLCAICALAAFLFKRVRRAGPVSVH